MHSFRIRSILTAYLIMPFPMLVAAQTPDPPGTKPKIAAGTARLDAYGDPLPDGAIIRIGTRRLRQDTHVTCLIFSKDGKTLLTGGALDSVDKTIPCWDTLTGKLVLRIACQQYGAHFLALSPDGKTLATVSDGRNDIWLLDFATGKVIHRFGEGVKDATHIAAVFSPDGKTLASCGAGGVLLWDVKTGKLKRRFPNWGAGWGLAFSPNGKLLAGAGDASAHLGDIETGKELWQVALGTGYSWVSVAFAPNGSTVATNDEVGNVRLIDSVSGKELKRLSGHKKPSAVAFSPDGQLLACGDEAGIVRLWDMITGKVVRQLTGHEWGVSVLAFAPNGKTLAVAAGDSTVRLWNVSAGKELLPFRGHRSHLGALSFSPNGNRLASGDTAGKIVFWDSRSGHQIQEFQDPTESIHSLSFSPNGTRLASAWTGGKACILDADNAVMQMPLKGHRDRVYSSVFSPDGSMVATASIDSTIRLWSAASGKEILQMEGGAVWKWVQSLAFSPDGRALASGREDGTIRIFDVTSGKETRRFIGHHRTIYSIAISSDGQFLASGGEDGIIRLWDFATGKELRQLKGHGRNIHSLALSVDGRYLISGGEDKTVRLWERASGHEIRVFTGHDSCVYSVAFAPDGRSVGSGSRDTTILLWDVSELSPSAKLGNPTPSIDNLWNVLGDGEAPLAHAAVWTMIRLPSQSVLFLGKQMKPAVGVSKETIGRLVGELDVDQFAVREKAQRELERHGELAVPALRKALDERRGLEFQRRVGQLLEKLVVQIVPAQQLRFGRALTVLEQVNTPAAREVLERLAKGADGAWLTKQARLSLARLKNRR